MHAWSEVDHDLVYKPAEGELSPDEHSLLDQLNGLVLAGEIALEQLQKAGETRVAAGGRRFKNHYELAAHLLSQVSSINEEPVTESGLGRIDLLFELLLRSGFDTPDRLRPYLELLHADLERRPLSDQIVDALIAGDASLADTYASVRAEADLTRAEQAPRDQAAALERGRFMERWAQLDRLVRDLIHERYGDRPPASVQGLTRDLTRIQLLQPESLLEFDRLRRIRNQVVHGTELPSAPDLAEATRRLDALINNPTCAASRKTKRDSPGSRRAALSVTMILGTPTRSLGCFSGPAGTSSKSRR